MKKVCDISGREIVGLYKNDNGTVVIKNDAEYKKYMNEKTRIDEIKELKDEIRELHEKMELMYNQLMNK